jgi:hypothetical protein
MRLLIDDVRDIGAEVIARSYKAASQLLELHVCSWKESEIQIFSEIYFDNDLGYEENYKDGYNLLTEYLEERCMDRTKIGIVTSNPVAKDKMEAALKNSGYTKDISTQLWVK